MDGGALCCGHVRATAPRLLAARSMGGKRRQRAPPGLEPVAGARPQPLRAGRCHRPPFRRPPAPARTPFAVGVAGGEPAPDGLVLWTRLLLAEPGQQQTPYSVRWELAHDSRFARIV